MLNFYIRYTDPKVNNFHYELQTLLVSMEKDILLHMKKEKLDEEIKKFFSLSNKKVEKHCIDFKKEIISLFLNSEKHKNFISELSNIKDISPIDMDLCNIEVYYVDGMEMKKTFRYNEIFYEVKLPFWYYIKNSIDILGTTLFKFDAYLTYQEVRSNEIE